MLIRVCKSHQQRSGLLRFSRGYAWFVTLGYSIALLMIQNTGQGAALLSLYSKALTTLAWTAGLLAALGAAQNGSASGAALLFEQRGLSPQELCWAQRCAAIWNIAARMYWPALFFICVLLLRAERSQALLLLGALAAITAIFVALFALVLGFVAELSLAISPQYPRALLLALVVIPWLVSLSSANVPNLPAFFTALLANLRELGAGLS